MIAIVGAGAAGLATAIFARRRGVSGPIVLFDGARHLGAKILVSGGGRCNVTNRVVTADDFSGGSRHVVRRILGAFSAEAAASFFEGIGVPLLEEEGGKLFPQGGRARSVLEALIEEAGRCDVDIRCARRVESIGRGPAGLRLETREGVVEAPRVVLATGGLSLPKTGSDGGGYALATSCGHTLNARTPALVPLVLEGSFHRELSGVSVRVDLQVKRGKLPVKRLVGPMLFTHFGVSGPVVLDASRHYCQAASAGEAWAISACFLPGLDHAGAEAWLLDGARARPASLVATVLGERLPGALAQALAASAGAEGVRLGRLTREARRALVGTLTGWRLPVRESRGFNFAEVTAGGVPLGEIDAATMASRRCPGLYLVGEILDVDGRIGGFNFQWAWSSAWVAAGGLSGSL